MSSISFGSRLAFPLKKDVFNVCEFELAAHFNLILPRDMKLFSSSGTEMRVRTNTCSYTKCPCISESNHCWLVSPESNYYITSSSADLLTPQRSFPLSRFSSPGSSCLTPPRSLTHFSSYPISPDTLYTSVNSSGGRKLPASSDVSSPGISSSQEQDTPDVATPMLSYSLPGRKV